MCPLRGGPLVSEEQLPRHLMEKRWRDQSLSQLCCTIHWVSCSVNTHPHSRHVNAVPSLFGSLLRFNFNNCCWVSPLPGDYVPAARWRITAALNNWRQKKMVQETSRLPAIFNAFIFFLFFFKWLTLNTQRYSLRLLNGSASAVESIPGLSVCLFSANIVRGTGRGRAGQPWRCERKVWSWGLFLSVLRESVLWENEAETLLYLKSTLKNIFGGEVTVAVSPPLEKTLQVFGETITFIVCVVCSSSSSSNTAHTASKRCSSSSSLISVCLLTLSEQ